MEEAISGSYDSSSPDGAGAASSPASKNIVSERNRRQKLNQRLFALRSVVPNITKVPFCFPSVKLCLLISGSKLIMDSVFLFPVVDG